MEVGGLACRVQGHADGAEPRVAGPVFVLLHGRGADESDLLGLAPYLPAPSTVVTPRAPFPAAAWGYGPGWAWYRFLGEDRPEAASFAESLDRLGSFLAALPDALVDAGMDAAADGAADGAASFAERLVLGGFSQGGTTSLAYALAHPGAAHSILIMSGFLADHPRVVASPASVAGMRFFWGHGTHDPAIPHALAVKGREALAAAGADLAARDYPMGHGIAPAELRDVADWLK